jgi:hypothetical protein
MPWRSSSSVWKRESTKISQRKRGVERQLRQRRRPSLEKRWRLMIHGQ